jgi:predicted MFS family arabinose efflux permease
VSQAQGQQTPQADRYPRSFYLAVAANLFFFTSFQWTFATLPGYIQAIGGDATDIGLAFGLFALSAVVARPGIGWLIDRWGRKPVLLVGSLVFVASPVLYALSSSLWPFQAVRLLHGLGIAAFTTAYTALVADLAPAGRRGEAVGLAGVTNNLGMLFAPVLGQAMQSGLGYAAHFWAAGSLAVISFCLVLAVVEPKRHRSGVGDAEEGAVQSFWAAGRIRAVWVAAFGSTGLAVAYGAVMSFMPPHAAERNLTTVGGYYSAFAAAMIVAQASAGWLSDRVGRRAVAAPGMLVVALAMFGLARTGSDLGLLAAGALLGISWGLVRAGLDTAVVDAVAPSMRGTALSFLYTCFDIGVGVGAFGLGVLAQARSYAAAFYATAVWAVVALLGYWAASRGGPDELSGI